MKFASLEKHIPVSERGRRTRPTATANTPAGTHGRARVPSVTPDERPKQTKTTPTVLSKQIPTTTNPIVPTMTILTTAVYQ